MIKLLFCLLFPVMVLAQNELQEIEHLISEKKYNLAQTKAKTYLESNPNQKRAQELLGESYGYQEKWDLAIEVFKKLIKTNPNNVRYQYKYGGSLAMKAKKSNKLVALWMVNDIKTAFLKAAKLDPNHIETRWALVEFYMQLPNLVGGSKEKSLKYAEELQQLSPVDGYLAKGYIYEYDDKPILAEKFYKKAIEVGGSLTCYKKLSDLYQQENKPQEAIEIMVEAKDKHQRNALHYQIGKVCADYNIELDIGEQFLKTYIKNYTVKDGVPIAWANYRLAQIYRHKNDKKKALKYINFAITELPKFLVFKTEKNIILQLN